MTKRGGVEVWQAAYDNTVPIDLHGGVIDSLTHSLTNQEITCSMLQELKVEVTPKLCSMSAPR